MNGLISSRMASIPMVASCVFRVTLTPPAARWSAAAIATLRPVWSCTSTSPSSEAMPDITSQLLSTLAFPSTQSVCGSPPVAMNTTLGASLRISSGSAK